MDDGRHGGGGLGDGSGGALTDQPTTDQPTTDQPTTDQPTTVQPTSLQPTTVLSGSRSGCPVIHLDTVVDRPVGEWMADLNRLRQISPILWNEHGGYWVLTRAQLAREVFQNPTVFTNDSISPGDPEPAYRWIPSNVNPPLHVQYRQILNHAFGPAPVARAEAKARLYCRMAIEDVAGRGGCDFVADVAGIFPTRVFLELVDLPWEDTPLFVQWAETIFDGFFHTPEAMAAFDELAAVLRRADSRPAAVVA